MFQKECNKCGEKGFLLRVKRTFIERNLTHKKEYKLKCNNCNHRLFISLGTVTFS